MYVTVNLSPSASLAVVAQVNVEPTVADLGLMVAAVTVGVLFEIVTVVDAADSALVAVPSLAKAVQ